MPPLGEIFLVPAFAVRRRYSLESTCVTAGTKIQKVKVLTTSKYMLLIACFVHYLDLCSLVIRVAHVSDTQSPIHRLGVKIKKPHAYRISIWLSGVLASMQVSTAQLQLQLTYSKAQHNTATLGVHSNTDLGSICHTDLPTSMYAGTDIYLHCSLLLTCGRKSAKHRAVILQSVDFPFRATRG